MSVGAETVVSDEWIDATLKASAPLQAACTWATLGERVFDSLAPDDEKYPVVVYQLQTSPDVVGVGPKARIMTSTTYVVRGIYEGPSFTPLKPVARAIDLALDGLVATLPDGLVLGVQRTEEYRLIEQHESRQIRHLGGIYSVLVQSF